MSKKFLIGGAIVDSDTDKYTFEDVTTVQVKTAIQNLKEDEDIIFEITSPGGSCYAGLAIANMIKQASGNGHKTTAHIIGVAASIASVIACACDEVIMDESAFMMIHNPFTYVAEGDAETMRRTADTLDKFKAAIISIYKSKFNLTEEELSHLMDKETWFTGKEANEFKFKCSVVPNEQPLKAAACAKQLYSKNTPKKAMPLFNIVEKKNMEEDKEQIEQIEEIENVEQPEIVVVKKETVTETVETKTEIETIEKQPTTEEVKEETVENNIDEEDEEIDEEEYEDNDEMIKKSEADKRVSGMQSVMAKKIDKIKNEFKTQITNLTNQLKIKDEELTQLNNKVINLVENLEKTKNELQETVSALEEKSNALTMLNANVNSPAEMLPTFTDGLSKCKTPAERVAFITSKQYRNY